MRTTTCTKFFYLPHSYSIQHGTDYKFTWSLSQCVSICLTFTEVATPKSKNELVGGQHRTTPSPILPLKTPILGA